MKGSLYCFLLVQLVNFSFNSNVEEDASVKTDLLVVTVATNETDGYRRFMASVHHNNIPIRVLGMKTKWRGGSMNYAGGGYKINLVKKFLEEMYGDNIIDKDKASNTVVMFVDSYDVVLLGDAHQILDRFDSMDARVVFSAEIYCWPDKSLAVKYPSTESPYKYLNSGGYIGYGLDLYHLMRDEEIGDEDDDQLYLTKLYLDNEKRDKYKMRLDSRAGLFQNLNGVSDDVTLRQDEETPDDQIVLINTRFDTSPLVLHGNGPNKVALNTLGNYLAGAWHPITGCKDCRDRPTSNAQQQEDLNTATVLLSIFVTVKTPFLPEFFQKITALNFPKSRLHVFVYNSVEYHEGVVEEFVKNYSQEYLSFKQVKPKDSIDERSARSYAVERCLKKKCGYLFSVDSISHLDSPSVLRLLISNNKSVVGPMLARPFKAWSNFWGAISEDGFYARSFDYMDIVSNRRRGVWNVPYLTHCYLVNSTVLPELMDAFKDDKLDPDMALCKTLRDKGIFMYVDNLEELGHLIDYEQFSESSRTNPEFYEIFSNQVDWEKRYIHPDFHTSLEPGAKHLQPCPDVYWFPIVTPKFCLDLVEIMETFGKWSSGTNYDERLTGGYENVPTRDIHMNQVGLERHWLQFLKLYIRPLQEAVFIGYYHDPPQSLMNFVVRYRPDEQPYLRPHHDSSTYTINIALNRPRIDFEGGGCRFIRYNCSVTDTRLGWVLMHPGRLTHYHEGLPVTNGTRYIMISFVNP